jgi:hypothetical protein
VRRRDSLIYQAIETHMAVRVSALRAGRPLSQGKSRFLRTRDYFVIGFGAVKSARK